MNAPSRTLRPAPAPELVGFVEALARAAVARDIATARATRRVEHS